MLDYQSEEYKNWRTKVVCRDGYACVECGSTHDLHVHHIKSAAKYTAMAMDVRNGKTLCGTCHKNKHPHKFNIPKYKCGGAEYYRNRTESEAGAFYANSMERKRNEMLNKHFQRQARREAGMQDELSTDK